MTDKVSSPVPELLTFEKECFHASYEDYFKLKRGNFFRSMTKLETMGRFTATK